MEQLAKLREAALRSKPGPRGERAWMKYLVALYHWLVEEVGEERAAVIWDEVTTGMSASHTYGMREANR